MKNSKGIIFDLDGTLYDFWGKKFSDSRLWIQIREKSQMFIQKNIEGNPQEIYEQIRPWNTWIWKIISNVSIDSKISRFQKKKYFKK